MTDIDRGEPVTLMEPLLIGEDSRLRRPLTDLAIELAAKSAGFRRSLPSGLLTALADLVRSMNCYYSNLIEGHDTHPIDIERALKNDYSTDPKKRDLQVEATAHIAVQRWIDAGNFRGRAVTADGLREIHSLFCGQLPDDMLWVTEPDTHERLRVVPGDLRHRDVRVSRHIPVSPGAVPRFLARFENVYGRLGTTDSILAAAAAHHRLLWIHPFLDGNDLPRRNDLDGRGHLSEEALASFTGFFLTTCIDQVTFMEGLMQPERLRTRILLWAEEETRLNRLPPKTGAILEALLYRGELPRGEVGALLDLTPRHARRIVAELLSRGVLASKGQRDPLLLAFPAALASRWMPGLFPERASDEE